MIARRSTNQATKSPRLLRLSPSRPRCESVRADRSDVRLDVLLSGASGGLPGRVRDLLDRSFLPLLPAIVRLAVQCSRHVRCRQVLDHAHRNGKPTHKATTISRQLSRLGLRPIRSAVSRIATADVRRLMADGFLVDGFRWPLSWDHTRPRLGLGAHPPSGGAVVRHATPQAHRRARGGDGETATMPGCFQTLNWRPGQPATGQPVCRRLAVGAWRSGVSLVGPLIWGHTRGRACYIADVAQPPSAGAVVRDGRTDGG